MTAWNEMENAEATIKALSEPVADGCLFPGKLVEVSEKIRKLYKTLAFDHRPFLHPKEYDVALKQTEHYRIGHICFKMAVSRVLSPLHICEIGVSSGGSALAFLMGAPDAAYCGIDNEGDAATIGADLTQHAKNILRANGFNNFVIRLANSLELNYLEPFDLLHVDGNHEYKHCFHDVLLALYSKTEWILVDDSRDSQVAAATLDALYKFHPGSCDWAFFDDTWTGNILIHNRAGARP